MKVILNESPLSEARLRPLIDFATPRSESTDLAVLAITNEKPGRAAAGFAEKFSWAALFEAGLPSLVTISIGEPGYPFTSCFRVSVGPVTFNNWKEEFLFVLAHELKHIEQFWSLFPPQQYEVDAERHAVTVLAAYREQQTAAFNEAKRGEKRIQSAARRSKKHGKRHSRKH